MDLSIPLTASVVANLFLIWKIKEMHRFIRNALALLELVGRGDVRIDREGNIIHTRKEA